MAKTTVDETGAEVANRPRGNVVPADLAAVREAALVLLRAIPDMPEGDGAGILADILNAESWEDLGTRSKLPAGKDLVGVEMKIMDVHKMPSTIESEDDGSGVRLDHFIIVDAVRSRGGKELRWQTSSPGIVLKIGKLYTWGKLPAVCTITQSAKPTRRGFYPIDLQVDAVS